MVSNTNGISSACSIKAAQFSTATTQGILPLYLGDTVPGPFCNTTDNYVVDTCSSGRHWKRLAAGESDVAASVSGVAYVFQNQGAGILSPPTQGFVAGPDSTMVSTLTNATGLNGLLLATSQGTAYLVNGGSQPSPSCKSCATQVHFGSVDVDSVNTQQLAVTNTGGLPFNITAVSVAEVNIRWRTPSATEIRSRLP